MVGKAEPTGRANEMLRGEPKKALGVFDHEEDYEINVNHDHDDGNRRLPVDSSASVSPRAHHNRLLFDSHRAALEAGRSLQTNDSDGSAELVLGDYGDQCSVDKDCKSNKCRTFGDFSNKCGCNFNSNFGVENNHCSGSLICDAKAHWHCVRDIDECKYGTDNCDHTCTNTYGGSFTCSCNAGYTLDADGHTCKDINECAIGKDNCNQICTNAVGRFRCSCNAGYTLDADGHTCKDIDECRDGTANC